MNRVWFESEAQGWDAGRLDFGHCEHQIMVLKANAAIALHFLEHPEDVDSIILQNI